MSSEETTDICERSFDFAVRIIKLCQKLSLEPGVNRMIANQLLRSGTSVGANIEEAHSGQCKVDFIS